MRRYQDDGAMTFLEGLKLLVFCVLFGVVLGHVVQWEISDVIGWVGLLLFLFLIFIPLVLAQGGREARLRKIADEINGDLAPEDHVDPDRIPNRYLPWYLKNITPYVVVLGALFLLAIFLLNLLRG